MITRRVGEEKLIDAWHSDEHINDIARRLNMHTRSVQKAWRRLQEEGHLPKVQRHDKSQPLEDAAARRQREQSAYLGRPDYIRVDSGGVDKLAEALAAGKGHAIGGDSEA